MSFFTAIPYAVAMIAALAFNSVLGMGPVMFIGIYGSLASIILAIQLK